MAIEVFGCYFFSSYFTTAFVTAFVVGSVILVCDFDTLIYLEEVGFSYILIDCLEEIGSSNF